MDKKDIVIFALSRIDSQYSSTALSLANEFSNSGRVYYISNPYSYKDYILQIFRRRKFDHCKLRLLFRSDIIVENNSNFVVIIPPLTIPINWISNIRIHSLIQNINNSILKRTVEKVVSKYDLKSFIYLNIFNPFYEVSFSSSKVKSVYYSVDDISQDSYTKSHGVRLEQRMISKADMVLVTSSKLYEKFQNIATKISQLNNAVNFSLFNSILNSVYTTPKELKKSSGEVIGYIGNLDDNRVDFELLLKIAKSNLDKTLLLVGPVPSKKFYDLGLDKMKNVITTGAKKIDELPAYIRSMEVALIPFNLNKLTASIYPLKINEYLAIGKFVVSTNFSRDIKSFENEILIANSHEDFLKILSERLNNSPSESSDVVNKRINAARKNSWGCRVDQFWSIMENTQNV